MLKVAMLISLSRRTDLLLLKSDIEESIDACISFLVTIDKLMLTMKKDKKKIGIDKAQAVFAELIKAREKNQDWVSRTKLIQKTYGEFNAHELDVVIKTLNEGNIIEERPTSKGPLYRLSEEMYSKLLRGG